MAEPTDTSTPEEILARLPAAFDAAKASGELFFYDSTSRDVPGQFPFQVRTCPALSKKTKEPDTPPKPEAKRTRVDAAERPSPFRPPYVPDLFVGALEGVDGEEKTSVLLNKFAVLPHHFLLCPVVEQSQSLPPTPGQLARAYSLLQAASRTSSKRLLAFYNGGPGAGASQRWRHIQFIEADPPVEQWCRSLTFDRPDRAVVHPTLPYLHIVHPLPPAHSIPYPSTEENLTELADKLAPALLRVLDLGFDSIRRAGLDRNQGWNLLMTLDHIHLIPRSSPSYPLSNGTLELNSLGYAGLLLVRSDEESAALDAAAASLPDGLGSILAACGIPRELGEEAIVAEATQHGGAGALFDGLGEREKAKI